jgi:hypothetical protein
MRSFTCKLTKLQRGNRAYDLLKSFKDDLIPDFEYSTVTEYYAAERATIIELFARFDGLYRERKRQLGALDYERPGRVRRAACWRINRMSGAACKTSSTRC